MKCDVIVVGAGPAGSTAAKFLSEKGLKVILLDKCRFPRDKPCGGGLPAKVLKKFDYINETMIYPAVTNTLEILKANGFKLAVLIVCVLTLLKSQFRLLIKD